MTIFNILISISSAFMGGLISYFFVIRQKKYEAILRFKEEKYANLLIYLKGFVGNTISVETKEKFFEEQYKSWIYASDEVVVATNTMVEIVKNSKGKDISPEIGRKAIGEIVLAIRKDLLGKTKLNYSDFTYTSVFKD